MYQLTLRLNELVSEGPHDAPDQGTETFRERVFRDCRADEKWVIEEALMLVFRGFLKLTENHTVLLMGGNSVAVALRDGELYVSVINGHQNRLALAREEERARAATLEARIAKRRREIRDERGF